MASLVLAVLVLPSATTAAVATATRNCSDTCGMVGEIPYPFGLGPSCSLPGFSLTCADNTSYPMLGNLPIESFDIFDSNNLYANISYAYNYLCARISYTVKMIPGVRDYSVHWEAPARHFAMSGSLNMLFVVGCGVKASLFIGNSTKLPKGVCDGIGCCFIDIRVNLRAFTLNISRTSGSARSKEVYAFISGGGKDQIFWPIDALRSMLPEYLEYEFATLEWAIPYKLNCKRAMEDRASYACVANHSHSVRTRRWVDTFAFASGATTATPTLMPGARNTNHLGHLHHLRHLHRLPLLRQSFMTPSSRRRIVTCRVGT
ncbi:unnamed protein product [Triticum turgidum subsp. durum]|uniref:Wall-associated receptor kinase galacturonan-binding domain-containing protein n=1 Tax=Triticum turgidum subsp. durum TaxID=4567 RepID=A0A9R1P9A3_TRITD|nr:unnamed protein product [Triticum turgidum subsp. durum]